MPAVDPCVLTGALANDYFAAVQLINRKFNALRRLAELLEQIGDIQGSLPNISSLIPLYLINVDAYANLVTACPFLNLPPHPTNEDIAKLQAEVAAAYQRLLNQLFQHPYLRMGSLQAQLDKVQASVNDILNNGAQFMQCLLQACASAASVAGSIGHIASTHIQNELDDYSRTYLANNGKVLTDTMQGKKDQVQGVIDNVNELMSPAPVVTPPSNTPHVSPLPNVPQIPLPPPEQGVF